MPRPPVPDAASVLSPEPGGPRWLSYGDAIRVVGTWAVVVGHVADMKLFDPHAAPLDWWLANVVDAACRWAVPAYIMLSGAILLSPQRTEGMRQFYGKRLARLGVPIAFWTVFFLLFSIYYTGWSTWSQGLRGLALGQPYAHLHFVYRIMGLYLFTPLLRSVVRHTPRKHLIASVVLMLVLASGDSIVNGLNGTEPSVFARFLPFIGYYLAGYLLRETVVTGRRLVLCWVGLIGSIALLAGVTGLLVQVWGLSVQPYPSLTMLMYDFMSPVRIVMAICAWLILVHYFTHNAGKGLWPRLINRLAPATLGIYLIHPAFREILHINGYTASWPIIWVGLVLVPAMVYLPSLAATWLIMKVPVVRRIVG